MTQTTETQNKALVLEAFDTLFNKRDYAAAERYWSPDYIQHSALNLAEKGSSISSRAFQPRYVTNQERLSPRVTS